MFRGCSGLRDTISHKSGALCSTIWNGPKGIPSLCFMSWPDRSNYPWSFIKMNSLQFQPKYKRVDQNPNPNPFPIISPLSSLRFTKEREMVLLALGPMPAPKQGGLEALACTRQRRNLAITSNGGWVAFVSLGAADAPTTQHVIVLVFLCECLFKAK